MLTFEICDPAPPVVETIPTPIPGFVDYGATADGRIFSRKLGDEWRELALHSKGKGGDYFKVKLYTKPCEYVQVAVHELIAITFIGPKPSAPEGMRVEVNHKDFNKRNNDAGNLEWLTHLENMQHAIRGGHCRQRLTEAERQQRRELERAFRAWCPRRPRRHLVGTQMLNHKLTEDDVRQMRVLYGELSLRALSRTFGVSLNTAHRIVRRLKWKHL